MAKRTFMRVELVAPSATLAPDIRTFDPADVPALGGLMHRAYVDTVDYEGETPEQSLEEVRKTIRGEYGSFVPHCSKVFARTGRLLCATLITRFQERPFVAFTFTDPAFAGQGLARSCMQAAMAELFAQGDRELRLVVTLANAPAVKLYTTLGFQIERA